MSERVSKGLSAFVNFIKVSSPTIRSRADIDPYHQSSSFSEEEKKSYRNSSESLEKYKNDELIKRKDRVK